jgi:hypothetical protein
MRAMPNVSEHPLRTVPPVDAVDARRPSRTPSS